MSPFPTLAPVGQITDEAAQADAIAILANLAREARDEVQLYQPAVDDNLNLYSYGDVNGPVADGKLNINEIQTAIIAQTDIQTKEPPTVSLEPVETGEPPLYYWAGPIEAALPFLQAGLLMPQEVDQWLDPETQSLRPPVNIDPLIAGQLKALAVPEEMSPALQPGTIRPEWLVEFNDRTTAEMYQTVFDLFWDRSQVDRWIRKNLLDTNIQGWAWGLYEFDDVALKHSLRHLDIPQVYIDPTCYDVSEAQYIGFDLVIDATAAKALYPALADQIDTESTIGIPNRPDSITTFGQTDERKFERPMVVFRVFWLRNQVVPLSKEEAVALGLVAEVGTPDGQHVQGTDGGAGAVAGSPDLAGGMDGQDPTGATGDSQADASDATATDDHAGAGPVAAGLGGNGAADGDDYSGCILIADGSPTAPGLPNWPTRLGIRQLTQIGQSIVDDKECEFWDVPILHNVNIPMPGRRPFGFGEPFRLKSLQQANNSLVGAMIDHAKYFAAPITWIPQSVQDNLPSQFKNAFVKPGMGFVVPDEIVIQTGGKPIFIQEPSPTPPALPLVSELIKQHIEEQSGHTEALRGIGGAQDSGKKTELLQSAGSSQISFKASRTADMVRRLAHLMLHSLVWRLEVDDIEKIISKYPRHLLEAFCARAREIEWNVKVVVHANAGEEFQKQQNALLQYQAGLSSKQTAQEANRLDPRLEEQRQMSEAAKMARTGLMTGPGGDESQEGGGGGKKKGEEKPAA